jgi:hypothetical protein
MEILFVVAVVVVLGIAFVVLSRRSRTTPSQVSVRDSDMEEGVVSEPVPVVAAISRTMVHKAEIDLELETGNSAAPRWAKQFEPASGMLGDAARLKLIKDLGMLRAAWCIPLLERAYVEETDSTNRTAAHEALARCKRQPLMRS